MDLTGGSKKSGVSVYFLVLESASRAAFEVPKRIRAGAGKNIRDSAETECGQIWTDTVSHCCMIQAYCPLTMAFLRQQRYEEEVCSGC